MDFFSKKYRLALLGFLLVFALTALGCGVCQGVQKAGELKETVEAGATSVAELATPAGGTGSETGDKTDEEDVGPETGGGETGDEEDSEPQDVGSPLDDLDSFRSRVTVEIKDAEGSVQNTMVTTMEWVREPLAWHVTTTAGAEEISTEIIVIGNKGWTRVASTDWVEYDATALSENPTAYVPEIPNIETMNLAGTETVNGIQCKHYKHDMGGTSYEIWIANQAGIPRVAVQAVAKSPTMATKVELYDINKSITIEAPK